MKTRLFKHLALIVVALLSINNLSVVANAFEKIQKIGFQIHVEYDETGANLVGDASQISNNIVLKSLKDELGNEYDPYEFKKYVEENGKYKYFLIWEDTSKKKEYNKEFVISVDRIAVSKEKVEDSDVSNTQSIENLETISIDQLKSISNLEKSTYNLEAYASESSWSLNKTVNFNGGYFNDDEEFINSVDDRIFDTAYIIRKDSNEQLEISALFIVEDNGKNTKFYIHKKELGSEPVIAYRLRDEDEIKAYFKLKNTNEFGTIQSEAPEGWDVKISENNLEKVLVGSKVVVTYTYPKNYINPNVTVKADGKDIQIENHTKDENSRTRIFSFTMPSSPIVIKFTGNKESKERYVGLQLGMYAPFHINDSGFASLWMDPKHYDSTPIYRNFVKKEKFTNSYPFGTEHSRLGAMNEVDINNLGFSVSEALGKPNNRYNNGNDPKMAIPSNKMNNHSVYTGIKETKSSKHGGHALASFEQGATLQFNFTGSRAEWMTDRSRKINYKYSPNSSIELKIFPDSNNLETENFIKKSIPLFQDKQSYEEQISNGELKLSEDGIKKGMELAKDHNGLYPVSTKLDNGMEIVCYQETYDPNGRPGKLNSFHESPGEYNFVIKVKNAVDSFLLSTTFMAESQQWYQANTNLDAFQTDENGPIIEAFNYKDSKKYDRITDGQSLVLGNDTSHMYDFRMKIKPGYSYPYIYITDFKNQTLPTAGIDVTKPDKGEMGRWWVDFNSNNRKLIKDTLSKDNKTDGYYHVRINAILKPNNHPAYPLYINSVPIQFNYKFKSEENGNGEIISEGENINVNNNKYFNVPHILPKNETGKKYFKGWKLQVKLGNGSKIEIKNDKNKYFNPGDLIDISYIADKLDDEFGIGDIGKESYELEFAPIYTDNPKDTEFTIGRWERKYQSSYNDMSEDTGKSVYVLPNELLYMSYRTNINNPDKYNGTYFLGVDSKLLGKVINENDVFANLNYYKGLKVNYILNLPNGIKAEDIEDIEDNNWYFSKNIKSSVNPPNVNEISHIIQLKSPKMLSNSNNLEIVGWELVNDKGEPFTKVPMYSPTDSVDLTKIIDTSAQDDIFNTGKINLKAIWSTPVKVINGDGSSASIKKSYQVALEDENLILTGQFKYINQDGSESDADFNDIKNNIKYALLKKGPTDTKYKVLLTEKEFYGDDSITSNSDKFEFVKIQDAGKQTFTITISLKKDYISSETDNGADYRIVAYTNSNKGMDKIVSSDLGGNGILGSGEIDFNVYELPIVSTYISYGAIKDIIKYPKEIAMFEEKDGSLDSNIEQIKLISYPVNNDYIQKLPNINREFKVRVKEDSVLMKNSINDNDTFEAKVKNKDGSSIKDHTLGTLKYSEKEGQVVSNIVDFRLRYENIDKRKFKDGEKFEGKLTFIFEKILVGGN